MSYQMYAICQGLKVLWSCSTPTFLRALTLIEVLLSATIPSSLSEMNKTWSIVPHLWCLKHYPDKAVGSFEGKGETHCCIPNHRKLNVGLYGS